MNSELERIKLTFSPRGAALGMVLTGANYIMKHKRISRLACSHVNRRHVKLRCIIA